jgi:hypothetical protein
MMAAHKLDDGSLIMPNVQRSGDEHGIVIVRVKPIDSH